MFQKIFIANRGEIAVRIIRACREMGIASVSVFSEVDRKALHVRLADEAYPIGPPPASQSYLCMEKIIETAKGCGAEAIHPGYGFLAENPDFVEAVEREGLIFIGPTAQSVRILGDKLAARKTMLSANVPVVPGTEETIESEEHAVSLAEKLGFPVLIKAAAGGGGKGMRLVTHKADIKQAMRGASSEAMSAFADSRLYMEKYLEKPRHIEIQILADRFGNAVYLGERECTIQRRHQKIIEESPSPIVDEKMRKAMGEAAVKGAAGSGYLNAGTVEFLVDRDKNFYFLEVNTRLQVEHPVTELVTGIDIVKEQIKIAAGERLAFRQEDIRRTGSALECRIYAEDPENNFFPSTGTITSYLEPAGPGIRVDSGLYEGSEVSLYYDPIVAKLISWGKNREEAVQRMKRALGEYRITGVVTTIPFHRQVMDNPKFLEGDISTHFIEDEFKTEERMPEVKVEEEYKLAAIIAALVDFKEKKKSGVLSGGKRASDSAWKAEGRRRGLRRSL